MGADSQPEERTEQAAHSKRQATSRQQTGNPASSDSSAQIKLQEVADYSKHSDQSAHSNQSSQPNQPDHSSHPDQSSQPDYSNQLDHPIQLNHPNHPSHPSHPGHSSHPAQFQRTHALEVAGITRPAGSGKILSWALWDWASAAFTSVATTFVFSVYLTTDGMFTSAETANQYLSIGTTITGVIIALLAPITGQRADRQGSGVRWLGWFTLCVFLTMCAMFFVAPESALGATGALWLGIGLLGLGNIFFEFASVNYNAMLNDISTTANRGKISGLGWGLGYVGGIVLLLFLYFGFINPEVGLFGVTGENGQNVRVAMLFAAAWYGIFAIPVLVNPPRRKFYRQPSESESIWLAYKRLWLTVSMIARETPNTLKFLVSSAVFRDGLAGVFTFGGVIAGSVFGFSSSEVIVFAIVANLVAGVATIGFGVLEDRFGSRLLIMVSLTLMVLFGMCVFFLVQFGAIVFWVFGLLLCIFVGPIQSASRAFLANVIPLGREGEIFGLYTTTGRAVSFLTSFMYGAAIGVGAMFTEGDATYWGILGIIIVLLAGLLLMIPVKGGVGAQVTQKTEGIE